MRERQLIMSLHEGALEAPASSIDRPQRLISTMQAAGEASRGGKALLLSRRIAGHEIERAHDPAYVDGLRRLCELEIDAHLDPELVLSASSFRYAAAAAGALLEAEQRAYRQHMSVSICLSRPGSHHAGSDYALGFCLLNNLAICARSARAEGRAERVAILDFDAHHGNGSEEIFADDPEVLTVSIHQYPFFPGSGAASSSSRARGIINLPLDAGAGDRQALSAYGRALDEIERFGPDLILVEAGVDAHREDWTTGLELSDECFYEFGRRLKSLVESLNSGLLLEAGGGYTELAVIGGMSGFLRGLL